MDKIRQLNHEAKCKAEFIKKTLHKFTSYCNLQFLQTKLEESFSDNIRNFLWNENFARY